MRQRAIDEAVKLVSIRVADSVQKEINNTLDIAAKKLITDIETKVSEWKKLVEEGKQVLNSLQSIQQHDFAKITDELSVRMFEIEQSLFDGKGRKPIDFGNEYDANSALKTICEIVRDIVNNVRLDGQYNGIAYNLHDQQLKWKILGNLISEHAAYVLGNRFEKLERIGNTADRL